MAEVKESKEAKQAKEFEETVFEKYPKTSMVVTHGLAIAAGIGIGYLLFGDDSILCDEGDEI